MDDSCCKELSVYWDYLGAHKPYSGLHTHMTKLRRNLAEQGVCPQFLGQNNFFYKSLLALPFSKLSCAHYSSLLLRSRRLKRKKVIFHSFANLNTDFLFPSTGGFFRVLTVHDVIPLLAKGKVSSLSHVQFKFFLKAALKQVDMVFCVSPWTKQCLENLFPEYGSKYHLVLNGYERAKPSSPREEKNSYERRLSSPNILCVSRYEPYKGFEKALSLLKLMDRGQMTFVTNAEGVDFLTLKAKEEGVSHRLTLLEGLGEEALRKLYRACDLFLCPSQFEGFGLPVIDAVAERKPVLFQKGHALDDFLFSGSSVGLSSEATGAQWAKAAQEALALPLNRVQFYESIEKTLRALPNWHQVAERVVSLYHSL